MSLERRQLRAAAAWTAVKYAHPSWPRRVKYVDVWFHECEQLLPLEAYVVETAKWASKAPVPVVTGTMVWLDGQHVPRAIAYQIDPQGTQPTEGMVFLKNEDGVVRAVRGWIRVETQKALR